MATQKKTAEIDYSMQTTIQALYELQKIDSKIDAINKVKGELPLEVQDLEDEMAGLTTRIENINAEIEDIQKDSRILFFRGMRESFFYSPLHRPRGRMEFPMKKNIHSYQKRGKAPATAILIGCGACILSFFATLLLFSMLMLMTKNPLVYSDTFSPLSFAVAGAIAGWIGRRLLGIEGHFLFCPALVILIALLMGLLLTGGRIALSALLSELIYLGACYLTFYLAGKRRERKIKRRR